MLNPNHGSCFRQNWTGGLQSGALRTGHRSSPDKMLQGRLFFLSIHIVAGSARITLCLPVNHPARSKPANYRRGGSMRTDGNGGITTSTQ
ncbi:catalase [Candidatus Binatus sp.]|uniref:catalase n=1 Tax=Candidatus Binatus sp. TaxID=2811406 RepID=UPI003C7025D5